MKQNINEIKRMQQLAGVINESQLGEARSPFKELGHEAGPNGTGKLNLSSQEGKYVADKIKELYTLLNDKNLIDFAKGYVDSISSSQVQYEGLPTVARMMLMARRDLK